MSCHRLGSVCSMQRESCTLKEPPEGGGALPIPDKPKIDPDAPLIVLNGPDCPSKAL